MVLVKLGLLGIGICLISSCSTTATRQEDGTLTLRGIGEAKWSDGTSIKGEPLLKIPNLPALKYEN